MKLMYILLLTLLAVFSLSSVNCAGHGLKRAADSSTKGAMDAAITGAGTSSGVKISTNTRGAAEKIAAKDITAKDNAAKEIAAKEVVAEKVATKDDAVNKVASATAADTIADAMNADTIGAGTMGAEMMGGGAMLVDSLNADMLGANMMGVSEFGAENIFANSANSFRTGRKARWGCLNDFDCVQSCRMTCPTFLKAICLRNECYCQALGYLRNDFRRPNEPSGVYEEQ